MKSKVLWLVVSLLAVVVYGTPASAQWTPPIGIPHPGFGIDDVAPALPSPWNANTADFYYVKQGGTNTGNGFPANPRGSMPTSGVPAGSVIVLDNSVAFGSGTATFTISWVGTASQPIFLQSSAQSPRAIWQADRISFDGAYVTIDFIDFHSPTTTTKGMLSLRGDHIIVRDSVIRGNLSGGGGTNAGGTGADPAHHIVWLRCTIRDNGDWQTSGDQDSHGVQIGANTNNVWLVDSQMFHNSGDGIQLNAGLGGATMASLHHIYIGRNTAYENKQVGFWSKQATDVIFSQNISHDHRPSASSPGAGLGQQYGPERVWYIFNTVYNCDRGIHIASDNDGHGVDLYVIGNLIYDVSPVTPTYSTSDSWQPAGMSLWDVTNRHIVGNTIWNCCAGIKCNTESVGKMVMVNNIVGQHTYSDDKEIWVPGISDDAGSEMNNNIIVGERIAWDQDTVETLAQFQTRTGKGANCSVSEPSFVAPGAKNFRLAASDAQARNKGVAHGVYDTYFSLYGVDIKKDIDGVTRPQAATWDIGAFEFQQGAPPAAESAPLPQGARQIFRPNWARGYR